MADLISSSKGYQDLLSLLKSRIRTAQVRAAVAVNHELVLLYWGIGKEILLRQQQEGWGAKVIDQLGRDLRVAFPEMQGFSPRNLKYMRAFAEAWPEEINCATSCCTIALGSQCQASRHGEDLAGEALVHPAGHPALWVALFMSPRMSPGASFCQFSQYNQMITAEQRL
jgi:hypothetical protein